MKRPEIDEICHNPSYIGVNRLEFYQTQTSKLYNTIILRKTEVCPSKISHKTRKRQMSDIKHDLINIKLVLKIKAIYRT